MTQPTEQPDRQAPAEQLYERTAARYDRGLRLFTPFLDRMRRAAVDRLELRPGHTVLDVGCGTGASLEFLQAAVGPTGTIVAIDQSRAMLDVLAQRAATHGWSNVQIVCSPVEAATVPPADGALFFLTHDLLQTPAALDNITDAVREHGVVVAAGMRRSAHWLEPLTWRVMRRYVTIQAGLDAPWRPLRERVTNLKVDLRAFKNFYIVSGTPVA